MHGATLERVTLVRRVLGQMEAACRSLGLGPIGQVLVNGWSGTDAFDFGPEVDGLVVALSRAAKASGASPEEAANEICTILRTLAEASAIRSHGLHEIAVSAEQAVGLGMMRFNMQTADFLPPTEALYVLVPKEFFRSEEVQPMLDSYCRSQTSSIAPSLGLQESVSRDNERAERFRERPSDVTVAVIRNGPCVLTNVVSCGVNTHIIFNASESIEETLSKPTTLSELDRVLVRVALSTTLLATMRPKDLSPMPLEPKQRRERDTLLSKLCTTVVHPSYLILQKTVRTLSRPHSEPTGRTRESPEERHVRPHFVHGHWRNQAHGPGWSLRRYRYIAPQIRHKHAFLGRPEDIITETRLEP
jgi:hypothetical protein